MAISTHQTATNTHPTVINILLTTTRSDPTAITRNPQIDINSTVICYSPTVINTHSTTTHSHPTAITRTQHEVNDSQHVHARNDSPLNNSGNNKFYITQ